jgi:hypothetical protein
MKTSPRMPRLAALALLCASACATKPAPPAVTAASTPAPAKAAVLAAAPAAPKLATAAEARGLALATVSVTSLDVLLKNGAALVAAAVPLPIDPSGVRDMLLAQAGLPPEVSANLDLGAPSGAAVVPAGAAGASGVVVAVAARGPAEAARALTALGKQIDARGDFVQIDNGSGGRGWFWRDGATIVFSDGLEALAGGARLAEEARHAVSEDITVVLFPDALARANGTDVKSALAMALDQLKQAQAATPTKVTVNNHAYERIAEVLALLGDAEAVELGLAADPGKGLSVRTRLRARTASGLEAIARESRPYALDTALLSSAKTPAMVGAWTIGSFTRSQMLRQREELQKSKAKGAMAALAFVDALVAGLGGDTTIVFGVGPEAPLFSGAFEYTLKDATAASAVAGALDRLDKDAAAALIDAQVGAVPFFDWTVKRESAGKLKALHYGLMFKKDFGLDPAVAKKVFGKGIDIYMAVSGTRLLTTFGRDAKASLGRVAAAAAAAPAGALADSVAATKGRDAFFHFDVAPLISLASGFAKEKDQRAEAIARANTGPIPIYGSAGGDGVGRAWSTDFTIPPAAFKAAGGLVRAAMAAGSSSSPPASPAEKPADKKGGKHGDKKAGQPKK